MQLTILLILVPIHILLAFLKMSQRGESAIENSTSVEISGQHNSNAVQSSLCFTFLMLIYSCGSSYMYCIIPCGKHCQIDCYRLLNNRCVSVCCYFYFYDDSYYYIQFLASLRKNHFCIYFLIKEKDVVLSVIC